MHRTPPQAAASKADTGASRESREPSHPGTGGILEGHPVTMYPPEEPGLMPANGEPFENGDDMSELANATPPMPIPGGGVELPGQRPLYGTARGPLRGLCAGSWHKWVAHQR